jgi:hypothetical protein
MQSRGGLGPGWYIPAVVNAAIPGKQGAVSLNGWAFRKWTPDPNGGVADSLDEAKTAFRHGSGAWERQRPLSDAARKWFSENSDQKPGHCIFESLLPI